MRVKIFGTIALAIALSAPASAGQASGFSHHDEGGVHIFKGHHGAPYSAAGLQAAHLEQQRAAQARQAAQLARIAAQLEEQSRRIDDVGIAVGNLERQEQRRPRRKVYYGNPRFFGPNGFVGNRNFSGGTIPLARSPRNRRRNHQRAYKK